MITVRAPIALDTGDMARLLNEIIEIGGTTARTGKVTGADIAAEMSIEPERSVWRVALDEAENVVGFQSLSPWDQLPDEAADISTFVQVGRTGLGIGSALFQSTREAAKALGYKWINANIRADNEGGLIYYQSRGFETYGEILDYKMRDGQLVNKVLKRFTL